MPYKIKRVKDGFKVGKKKGKKTFSKKPLSHKRALAQLRAIGMTKSDWKKDVDSYMVEAESSVTEKIMDMLYKKYKFNTPKSSEVIEYLKEKYKQDSLWSNLWSINKTYYWREE